MSGKNLHVSSTKKLFKNIVAIRSDAQSKILVLKEKSAKIDQLFPVDPSKELKEKRQFKIRREKENNRKTRNCFKERILKNVTELLTRFNMDKTLAKPNFTNFAKFLKVLINSRNLNDSRK